MFPFLKPGCEQPGCKGCPADSDAGFKEVRPEDVDFGNHIIGQKDPSTNVKTLASPRELTPAEWAEHALTHLPYCSSCPHCIAGKRPNCPHRRSTTDRKLPLLVADYGFLKDAVSNDSVPFLVVYIQPWRVYVATVVDMKGPDQPLVNKGWVVSSAR